MKIRSDFVSNSSSSSFIISTKKKFSDMCTDILNFQNDDPKITDNNFIALKYFTDKYIMLFLGYIPLYKETIDKDTKYECELDITASDIFTNDLFSIDYWKNYKNWVKPIPETEEFEEYTEEEVKSIFKKDFLKMLTNRSKYWDSLRTEPKCAKITSDTIKITENIIECGIDLKIDLKLLNSIKNSLENGESIYYITIRDEGEGMDPESIFISRSSGINVFGGYDFKKITECEIVTNFDENKEIPK